MLRRKSLVLSLALLCCLSPNAHGCSRQATEPSLLKRTIRNALTNSVDEQPYRWLLHTFYFSGRKG